MLREAGWDQHRQGGWKQDAVCGSHKRIFEADDGKGGWMQGPPCLALDPDASKLLSHSWLGWFLERLLGGGWGSEPAANMEREDGVWVTGTQQKDCQEWRWRKNERRWLGFSLTEWWLMSLCFTMELIVKSAKGVRGIFGPSLQVDGGGKSPWKNEGDSWGPWRAWWFCVCVCVCVCVCMHTHSGC